MTERACEALLDAAISYAEGPRSRANEDALVAAARDVGYEREKMQLLHEHTMYLKRSDSRATQ